MQYNFNIPFQRDRMEKKYPPYVFMRVWLTHAEMRSPCTFINAQCGFQTQEPIVTNQNWNNQGWIWIL